MRIQLQTYRLGSPRQPDEGLRIGVVRFWPRGVKKEDAASRTPPKNKYKSSDVTADTDAVLKNRGKKQWAYRINTPREPN